LNGEHRRKANEKSISCLFAGHRRKRFTERKKEDEEMEDGGGNVRKCKRKMKVAGKEIRGKGEKGGSKKGRFHFS
jgi:hypothetical protein